MCSRMNEVGSGCAVKWREWKHCLQQVTRRSTVEGNRKGEDEILK